MVTDSMVIGFTGRSPGLLVAVLPIFFTTSMPSTISPNTLCLSSSHGVAASVMKNWPPLVFGPAVRDRQDSRLRMAQSGVELVRERVTGTAGALPERIAALDHEAVDDAVEDRAVEVGCLHPASRPRIGPFLRSIGEAGE